AECVRAARQGGEYARLVAALVVFLSLVDVVGAALEHAVDQASELVGGGGDGFRGTKAGLEPAEEGAERGLAVVRRTGRQAERSRRPAGGGLGATAECLAAGDLRARREGQPGGEVFVTRPAAHVEAGLRDDFAGGGRVDAVDAGEIDAREAIEVGADIEGGGRPVRLGRARLGRERVARGLCGDAAAAHLDPALCHLW